MKLTQPAPTIASAAEITASACALYGQVPVETAAVLHVLAVAESPGQTAHVLRITPSTPKCAWDLFALRLARARADAIVISGKILRDEPELTYGAGASGEAFASFRRKALKKPSPPRLIVLTRDSELPLTHPIFEGRWPVTIATTPETARTLRQKWSGAPRIADVPTLWEHAAPSLKAVITRVQDTFGPACTVSLECGPSTVAPLYDETPPCIDEIMLSEFRGNIASELLAGCPWRVPPEQSLYHEVAPPRHIDTVDGTWTFRRLRQ